MSRGRAVKILAKGCTYQRQCPNWRTMAGVHFRPQSSHGDGVVTSEGPGTPRRSHCDRDRAEQRDDQNEKGQAKPAAWRVHHNSKDVRESLLDRCVQYVFQGRHRGTDGNDKE